MIKFLKFRIILFLTFICLTPSLSKAEEMKIVYARNYAPFCWQDVETKQAKGILVDFLEEILHKRMRITLKHEVYPWKRAQLMVKNNQADAFFTIPTESRKEYTVTTEKPFFVSNFIIFTGANNPNIAQLHESKTLQELKELDLLHLMIRGGGWHGLNLRDVKQVSVVNDPINVLKMLSANQGDVYVEQEAIFYYQRALLNMEEKVIAIPNVMDKTLWQIQIGKKSSFISILPELNKLMEEMEEDGSFDKIRQKIFDKYKKTGSEK